MSYLREISVPPSFPQLMLKVAYASLQMQQLKCHSGDVNSCTAYGGFMVTGGHDKSLIIHNGQGKLVRSKHKAHDHIIRALTIYHGPGTPMVISGSWDGKRGRKDGGFIVLESATLKPIFEGRDSRHWLRDVKFSPDGKSFAVASMDHKIYIYNRDTFRLKGTCDRHNSHVENFDFSEDSVYIQSDSGDYEHLYFEAEDGEYFASGSQLKNIRFADWTCTYGWPVQGSYFDDVEKGKLLDDDDFLFVRILRKL